MVPLVVLSMVAEMTMSAKALLSVTLMLLVVVMRLISEMTGSILACKVQCSKRPIHKPCPINLSLANPELVAQKQHISKT